MPHRRPRHPARRKPQLALRALATRRKLSRQIQLSTSSKRATNAKHAQQATSMRQAPSMQQNAAHPKPQCPGSRQSAQLFPSRGRCRSDARQERPRKCPLCRRCGARGMLYRFTFTCMVSMTARAALPSLSSLLATQAASIRIGTSGMAAFASTILEITQIFVTTPANSMLSYSPPLSRR